MCIFGICFILYFLKSRKLCNRQFTAESGGIDTVQTLQEPLKNEDSIIFSSYPLTKKGVAVAELEGLDSKNTHVAQL